MRIFTISDLHIDHPANRLWVEQLSCDDYRDDVLIVAGDVADAPDRLEWCMQQLTRRFFKVLLVPGNHDLWVLHGAPEHDSLDKFAQIRAMAHAYGVGMAPFTRPGLAIVPLLGWYDESFGVPGDNLRAAWMDYRACRWPSGFGARAVADHFLSLNVLERYPAGTTVIAFSHFLPRLDLLPATPATPGWLHPVLGCHRLDAQARSVGASMHVYGHSHLRQRVAIDGVTYVNNALGTPRERALAARGLLQIHAC